MHWPKLLSRRRLGKAETALADGRFAHDALRTDFQRDFDRIIFSSALRRLQDKTQVFPLAQNDYVRTRLTHSLEVASVGRTLGAIVGSELIARYRLDAVHPQDVGAIVAAACLAHDIGNPPFGHAGEDAIRFWFADADAARAALGALAPAEREDFLRFEGNAQGFRLLTRLQSPDNPGGMQLTCATLGAFSKYPCASLPCPTGDAAAFRKFGYYQAEAALFVAVASELGLTPADGCAGAWQRHPLAYLVEAADDICYLIIDVEDAYRLRRLSYADAFALLGPLLDGADHARLRGLSGDKHRVELLRAKAIGHLIDQVCRCFLDSEAAILAGRFDGELLSQVASADALRAIQQGASETIYFSPEVVEVGAAGFQVLAGLLDAFVPAAMDPDGGGRANMLRHLLPRAAPAGDAYARLLGVTDFIAGMTDSYAVKLYRKITGISLPG